MVPVYPAIDDDLNSLLPGSGAAFCGGIGKSNRSACLGAYRQYNGADLIPSMAAERFSVQSIDDWMNGYGHEYVTKGEPYEDVTCANEYGLYSPYGTLTFYESFQNVINHCPPEVIGPKNPYIGLEWWEIPTLQNVVYRLSGLAAWQHQIGMLLRAARYIDTFGYYNSQPVFVEIH